MNAGIASDMNRFGSATVFLKVPMSDSVWSGSPWFSPFWMHGQIHLSDGRVLPLPREVLLVNFDKTKDLLVYKKTDSVIAIKSSELVDFQMQDDRGIHSFVRVPGISQRSFFEELVGAGDGFALYKKVRSRFRPPDYTTIEYNSANRKPGRYLDDTIYYLIFPNGKKYIRFSLNATNARKKIAGVNETASRFMKMHAGPVDLALLFALCDELNETGPPGQ